MLIQLRSNVSMMVIVERFCLTLACFECVDVSNLRPGDQIWPTAAFYVAL